MAPTFTERELVVEETELLNDVVHDEVDVDLRLVAYALSISRAQLAHLVDAEAFVWV